MVVCSCSPQEQHQGSSGQEGMGPPVLSHVHSVGGLDPRDPQKHTLSRVHSCSHTQRDIQRQQGAWHCSRAGGLGCRLSPTRHPTEGLRTSPSSPMATDPRRNPSGGCPHPLIFLPLAVGGSASTLGWSESAVPPPAVPLLADPGGGMAAGSPLADGVGSQHRWPCATADWGRLPAKRLGRAASLPRLGDKSKARVLAWRGGAEWRGTPGAA